MRAVNGHSRPSNDALHTINAAASAIASAENRVPQATVQVLQFYIFFIDLCLIFVYFQFHSFGVIVLGMNFLFLLKKCIKFCRIVKLWSLEIYC